MESERIRKLSMWRPMNGCAREKIFGVHREQQQEAIMKNPWELEAGFSFSPKEVSILTKSNHRRRTFTGTFHLSKSSLPATIRRKAILMRLGISLFFVFDLLLMAVFIRTMM